jgi:photosystem II stability/assembly factor-like uncharacterized protein
VDHTDPNVAYAEWQWGNITKSTNGGASFGGAANGIDRSDRFNWNTSIAMDPNDHNVLYLGSHRLYRTSNGAGNWSPISGDLTDGPAAPGSNIISTVGLTAADSDVIYVGTGDANVWVTTDGGSNWHNRSAGLPDRWVTRVTGDPHDASVAYVTLSGYQLAEWIPHIFKTDDNGLTWTPIAGDLPDAPINDVIVDPVDAQTLYIATDFGVYISENLGTTWSPLGEGMPMQPVLDLDFNQPTRQIVAATHGRSMYRLYLECATGADSDGDGYADGCDNCPDLANADQADIDFDGVGDVCDPCLTDNENDIDQDGLCAEDDNCPYAANADQADIDGDGIGDACDPCTDTDGDWAGDPGYPANICDEDNCPDVYNPYGQNADADGDGVGDACDICPGYADQDDIDGDGIPDGCDGCCLDRVGNANGLGGDEPTIGDASVMIDAKFISSTCEGILPCLTEADMNQSGGLNPTCNDITIGDISILIDYLFIGGPSSVTLPDCL